MSEIKNLLFVCSRNKWRSKTEETVFRPYTDISVRSAGTSKVAVTTISRKLIDWADIIYVMEKRHKEVLNQRFGQIDKQIIVLNIPDEYQYMDAEIVDEFKSLKI